MPRSMSMSTAQPANDDLPPPPPPMDRESFLRRSLTLTSRADRVNLINSLTERISQRMQQNGGYSKVSTHHVIPVNGGGPVTASAPQQPPSGPPAPHQQHPHHHNNGHVNGNNQNKQLNNRDKIMSPEGEIYGFGAKFKETSQQYFDMSASYPNSNSNGGGAGGSRKIEEVENQKFIDALSSKLLGKPVKNPGNNPAGSGGKSTESNKAQLNAEIQRGSFQLRKTNGIQNDRSAPRF